MNSDLIVKAIVPTRTIKPIEYFDPSLHVQEGIARQEHLTEVGPGPLLGVLLLSIDRALGGQELLARHPFFRERHPSRDQTEGIVQPFLIVVAEIAPQTSGETLRAQAGELGVQQRE